MEMTEGYPFRFTMNDTTGADALLEVTLQYRFKSPRSHHTYIVRVERYRKHAYCLKFFDKANVLSDRKFSLRNNTFEMRTVLYTLYRIMLDVLDRDSLASFFFVGAEDERDMTRSSTRRYRIYRQFVLSVVSDEVFEHFRVNDLSLYILVNRRSVAATSDYASEIETEVRKAFMTV